MKRGEEETARARSLLEKTEKEKARFQEELSRMKSIEELQQSKREAEQLRLRYAKHREERKAKLEKVNKKVLEVDQLLREIQAEKK